MTDESLWNLFARTGLPEAYSLYHRSISGNAEDVFGQSFRDPFPAGRPQGRAPADHTRGT